MMAINFLQLKAVCANSKLCLLVFLVVGVGVFAQLYGRPPRAWAAGEVPVAFWAWHEHTPAESDVEAAVAETGATALFLHAGQMDCEAGKPRRIRAVQGNFPTGIPIHLVYNAARSLLGEFEHVDAADLAEAFCQTYEEDSRRAAADGASLAGLQLDVDVPTRLLPRYGSVLRAVRKRLQPGHALSITGLPAWMDSRELGQALDTVDFWIPQCYGAMVPERLDVPVPISSTQSVASAIDGARRLARPFYSGLAAYGYAAHYSTSGALLGLRGDLDPSLVANSSDFELVDRRPFGKTDEAAGQLPVASEWRYVYKARREAVIDGTVVRKGESLMLDMPAGEALRASAKAVRERAGKHLLGICIFRLPAANDPTALTVKEIANALAGKSPAFDIQASFTTVIDKREGRQYLVFEMANTGSARPILGSDALTVDLRIQPGVIGSVDLIGFSSMQSLCAPPGAELEGAAQPCRAARANILRLTGAGLKPGAAARASLEFREPPPAQIAIWISMLADDGRSLNDKRVLVVREGSAQ
jgi:hypothetical protein